MNAQRSQDDGRASKIIVTLMIVTILGGVAAWNAWDYFGTEGLNPKKVKKMAAAYERECVLITDDIKTCKRHIGMHHRECLPEGIDRAGPDEEPRPIRYDLEGYTRCMRAFQREDLGETFEDVVRARGGEVPPNAAGAERE